ncbi:MAG: addiction module antitoxin RelB [Anaerolinea sp.]|nr:addiction module antitoxin RelB [Anaerolinea sp.]
MIEIRETDEFKDWFSKLRDTKTRSIILVRIRRLSLGNFGGTDPVGEGVHEIKIDLGPGYRVYFFNLNDCTVIILCGGDKSTQQKDIEKAQYLAHNV